MELINKVKLKKALQILKALDNPIRRDIIDYLNTGEHNVTEIQFKLRLDQAIVSQHLSILRKAGFIENRKDGKSRIYRLNKERLDEINQIIDEITK